MSDIKRRKTSPHLDATNPNIVLPVKYKDTVRNHVNSVYVGTIVRIYDPACSDKASWPLHIGLPMRDFLLLYMRSRGQTL